MSDQITAIVTAPDTITIDISTETKTIKPVIIDEGTAVTVGIQPAAYVGRAGYSPRISDDGYWEIYDNETETWVKTDTPTTGDYEDLTNLPSINGVTIIGALTPKMLHMETPIPNSEIEKIFLSP